MSEDRRQTQTGGREATGGHIPGDVALAVGLPTAPTPTGFVWRRLADLARLETGHTPSRRVAEYWDGGTLPWIGVRDATGNHGRTIYETNEYITELGEQNSSTRLLPENTVCLSRTASVGYVVVMGVPMCTSQDFVNWVCGPDLDHRYLKYILLAEKQAFLRFASGTTHQTVYFPEVKAFHVMVPRIDEQRGIAEVLGALDDKIESNRRLARHARELVALELSAAEDDAWRSVSVSELAQFVNGGAYTKGATGTGRMVVRIAELNGGPGNSTIYNDLVVPDDKLAREGDLLMSWSGSLGVYIWVRPEAIINQHIFKVVCSEYPAWLVYNCLARAMPFFRQTAADKATTMGHIKRHHLDDARQMIPPPERLRDLDGHLRPVWDRAVLAEVEALELGALRDALLPELLSGRLRVRDAEAVLEGAV